MFGMMQIMIWLLCVYLVFKGIEIFQIAWVSSREGSARTAGIVLGAIMFIVACVAAVTFVVLEERLAQQMSDAQKNIPNFNLNR